MDSRTLRRRAITAVVAATCALAPAVATSSASAATTHHRVAVAPAITGLTAPVITGSGGMGGADNIGATLTVTDPGTWDDAEATFTYQWQASGVAIDGATGPTFTVTGAQSATPVSVLVTATGSDQTTASQTSNVIFILPGTPSDLTPPTITGTPEVGQTLSADMGTWDPADVTASSYQWLRDGSAIDGATTSTYTLTSADFNHQVSVTVFVGRSGWNPGSATSDAVTVAAGAAPVNIVAPSYGTDSPGVDSQVYATPGTWNVDGATYTYQWQIDGADVSDPSGDSDPTTFTPSFDMLGHSLTVLVSATANGATSEPVASASAVVQPGGIPWSTYPTLSGDPHPGGTLTATAGSTDVEGATATYTWFVGDDMIQSNSPTYSVTPADVGKSIQAMVTLTAPNWLFASAFTDSVTIAKGTLTNKTAPKITGTPLVGKTLTAHPGTWSASTGVTHTYQWTANGKAIAGATKSTLKVPASAAGKRIAVIDSAAGSAWNKASKSSTAVAVKAPSKVTLKTTAGKGKVTVTVKVTAAVKATGKVTVKVGKSTRTVTLKNGTATLSFTKLKAGKTTVTATYAGTAAVTAGKATTSARVK